MDQAITEATQGRERMDTDGRRAAAGTVSRRLLARLLSEPYYSIPPPKSTGMELFHASYVQDALGSQPVHINDLLATLTELSATLIADAAREHEPGELIVAGGGVHNHVLMKRIRALAGGVRVTLVEDHGLPSQGKEAYLMALLGYLTIHGLPGTIPSATGSDRGSVLGSITPGKDTLKLPEPAKAMPRQLRLITPTSQRS
jgi:anhydro-N-acetylmuramic acid kinase